MKRVQFVKPFVWAEEVSIGGTDYFITFNANTQMEGYIADDLFTALNTGQTLAIDLDA